MTTPPAIWFSKPTNDGRLLAHSADKGEKLYQDYRSSRFGKRDRQSLSCWMANSDIAMMAGSGRQVTLSGTNRRPSRRSAICSRLRIRQQPAPLPTMTTASRAIRSAASSIGCLATSRASPSSAAPHWDRLRETAPTYRPGISQVTPVTAKVISSPDSESVPL